MASRKWFRLYADAVDNGRLSLLAFEDRWQFVALLCCKAQGLFEEPRARLRKRTLMAKLGLSEHDFDECTARLADVGLTTPEGSPCGWDARQRQSDFDATVARRQREFRQRNALRNALVTRLDTDTDTDTDSKAVRPKKQDVLADGAKKPAPFDPRPMLEAYAQKLPMLPQPRAVTPSRRRALGARWRDSFDESLATWGEFLDRVAASSFLTGRSAPAPGHSRWRCDLDFLLKPEKINAIAEGKYDDQA